MQFNLDRWEINAQYEHKQWWREYHEAASKGQERINQANTILLNERQRWNNVLVPQERNLQILRNNLSAFDRNIKSTVSKYDTQVDEYLNQARNYGRESDRLHRKHCELIGDANRCKWNVPATKAPIMSDADAYKVQYLWSIHTQTFGGSSTAMLDKDEIIRKHKGAVEAHKNACKQAQKQYNRKQDYINRAEVASERAQASYSLKVEMEQKAERVERNRSAYENRERQVYNEVRQEYQQENNELIHDKEKCRQDLYQLGQQKIQLQNDCEAQKKARQENRTNYYLKRARSALRSDEYQHVIDDCGRTLDIGAPESNVAHAYYFKGEAYKALSDEEEAIKNYSNAISLFPNHLPYLYDRAKAYVHFKNYFDARAELRDLLSRQFQASNQDFSHIIRLTEKNLKKVNAIIDDIVKNLVLKAEEACEEKDYDRALMKYKKAINWLPLRSDLYVGRGQVYEKMKNFDEAFSDYKTGGDESKIADMAVSLIRLAERKEHYGEFKQTLWCYNKVLEWYPNSNTVYVKRGKFHERHDDWNLAYQDYLKAEHNELAEALRQKIVNKHFPPLKAKIEAEYKIFHEIATAWVETKTKNKHVDEIRDLLKKSEYFQKHCLKETFVSAQGRFVIRPSVGEFFFEMQRAQRILYATILSKKKFRERNPEFLREMNDNIVRYAKQGEIESKEWVSYALPRLPFFENNKRKLLAKIPSISIGSSSSHKRLLDLT